MKYISFSFITLCTVVVFAVPQYAAAATGEPERASLDTTNDTATQNVLHMMIDTGLVRDAAHPKVLELLHKEGVPEGVALDVSQYIQESDRTYTQEEGIHGLLVRAQNTTDSDITYAENAPCALTYRIYTPAWKQVYVHDTDTACTPLQQSGLVVQQVRTLHPTEMIGYEMRHSELLPVGKYRVALSLNGVFVGVRTVHITQ
jgi:hypothetical protein